ncbi:MAG: NAD-dependent DNA ligase LigA, partial [Methanofastidiosum sp.]
MDKIRQIQNLVLELNQYRDEYYNLNRPSISDREYDNLVHELYSLERETGYVLSNSPTQTVGYEVKSKLQKRIHPTPLKSLGKTKSIDELNKWKKGKDVLLMLKADGLTIEVDYINGQFIGGYTRGNGEIGEDISHNAKVFKNLPLTISFKGKLRLIGEAIIHWNDFNKINSDLVEEEKYATPRNLTAGSVRQLSSKICSQRQVYFYVFGILECSDKLPDSKYERFKWLEDLGFWTIYHSKISGDKTIDNTDIELLKQVAVDENIPIDGLVASFDSVSYSDSLGETSHHPHHSIAYKLDDQFAETRLRDVIWNTTRLGYINPTAVFDTVVLDNTEVSRASLHNLSFIEELNLNIGCKILVSKRNLIIPHIEDNLDKDKGILLYPKQCPACNGETYIKNTGTANFLFCSNKQCPAKLLDKFVHFVKRDCMNIEGLSEATLEKFINAGFLKTFDDIYCLQRYKNKIVQMEGFGLKSYNNLIESIEKSREVKLSNFIYALGIPHIGKSAAKILAEKFNDDWFKFEEALCNEYDFTQLKDFGQITNDSLHKWYNDNQERSMWVKLTYILEFKKEDKAKMSNEGVFTGKKLYCTGKFASHKKDELRAI